MKLARALLVLSAAVVVAGTTACALDFNQFQPVDGSAPMSGPDSSKEPPGTDAETAGTDAEGMGPDDASPDVGVVETPDAGRADAGAPSEGGLDAGSSCTPQQSCLMMAQMCAMMCETQEQMCSSRCTGGTCRSQCRSMQTTCNTQCQDTCTSCTQTAGCSAKAACADAG